MGVVFGDTMGDTDDAIDWFDPNFTNSELGFFLSALLLILVLFDSFLWSYDSIILC
jgi:hypothetical protein